jgi:hypothetical protein
MLITGIRLPVMPGVGTLTVQFTLGMRALEAQARAIR